MNSASSAWPQWPRKTLVPVLAGLMLVGPALATDPAPERDDGLDVFFRESDLEAVAAQELARYTVVDPGDSEILGPAFAGAPPQIPHSVTDMLPIQSTDNVCLECHMPEEAEDMEATSIPPSHFRHPRIESGPQAEEGSHGMRVVVAEYEPSDELLGMQFFCVQCHTPQAENVTEPTSTFTGGQYTE